MECGCREGESFAVGRPKARIESALRKKTANCLAVKVKNRIFARRLRKKTCITNINY